MLKKLVVLGVIGFVAVTAAKHTKMGSYLLDKIESVWEQAEESIPMEAEIVRLRKEVKLLDKDIIKVIDQFATETVAVDQLRVKADGLRATQSREKELLTSRAAAIKAATEQVVFGDRKLTVAAATAELEAGVKRFSTNQKSLDSLDASLASREKVKDALAKQLDVLKAQKSELGAVIDTLDAELADLKLQQLESKVPLDNTRSAKIKERLIALKTKIDVQKVKVKEMEKLAPPAEPAPTKSVDDIMAALNNAPAKPAAAKPEPRVPVIE